MIPLGIIAAARTAGGGHQYWRWTYIMVPGSYFEISELRLVDASGVVPATMSSSSSPGFGSSGDLSDGNLSSRCWWDVATVGNPNFWIMADTGTPKEVTGMQMASYDNSSRWPTNIMLSWADSPSGPWNQFLVVTNPAYPGDFAWAGTNQRYTATPGFVAELIPLAWYSGGVALWSASTGSPGYNFHLGADADLDGDEPSYNPAGYFVFNGSTYFTGASGTPSLVKGMHKADAEYTIEVWWYYAGGGGNIHPIFDSGTYDGGGPDVSRGIVFGDMGSLVTGADGKAGFRLKQDSGGGSALAVALTTALTVGWHHLAVSYRQGAGCFLWVDGSPASTTLGTTWDGTPTSPGTADPANPMRIGARGDGSFRVSNGSRLGTLRIYDRALTQGELGQNWEWERSYYGLYAGGGGGGHRYWQIVGVTVAGGNYLQISELQLLVGATVVSAGITPSASNAPISHTLADLVDGQLAVDQVTWTQAVAQDPGFYIRFDLGAEQAVDGVRQAGGDHSDRCMSAFTLQYADSPSGPWSDYGSEVGLAYPGNYTLSEVYDLVPT